MAGLRQNVGQEKGREGLAETRQSFAATSRLRNTELPQLATVAFNKRTISPHLLTVESTPSRNEPRERSQEHDADIQGLSSLDEISALSPNSRTDTRD